MTNLPPDADIRCTGGPCSRLDISRYFFRIRMGRIYDKITRVNARFPKKDFHSGSVHAANANTGIRVFFHDITAILCGNAYGMFDPFV